VRVEFGRRLASAEETSHGRVIARFTNGSDVEGGLLMEPMASIRSRVRLLIRPRRNRAASA
jgi:hypothetical protein